MIDSTRTEINVNALADYIAQWSREPMLVYVVQGAVVAERIAAV